MPCPGGSDAVPAQSSRPLLAGKVCLVSGAGPGLGRQTALLLATHGADVVLAARRPGPLEGLAAEIEVAGHRALVAPTDITDPGQCERAVALAVDQLGGIDVLVNNAFRFDVFKTFQDVDLAAWRKIVDVNLFGTLQMTKAALPAMDGRGGSVVMVASMAARKPPALQGGYAISKGALLTATRVLAAELGPAGIRVNAVVPGWMLGPSVDVYLEMTSAGRGIPPEEVAAELAAPMPLGRVPSDADVAGCILFLASDLSSSVTGQAIDANGGEYFA